MEKEIKIAKQIYTGCISNVPTRAEEEGRYPENPIRYLFPDHHNDGNESESRNDANNQTEAPSESHDIGEIARIAYEFYGKHCGLPESDIKEQTTRLRVNPEAIEHVVFMLGELSKE